MVGSLEVWRGGLLKFWASSRRVVYGSFANRNNCSMQLCQRACDCAGASHERNIKTAMVPPIRMNLGHGAFSAGGGLSSAGSASRGTMIGSWQTIWMFVAGGAGGWGDLDLVIRIPPIFERRPMMRRGQFLSAGMVPPAASRRAGAAAGMSGNASSVNAGVAMF